MTAYTNGMAWSVNKSIKWLDIVDKPSNLDQLNLMVYPLIRNYKNDKNKKNGPNLFVN
jgi:hypothetical protein